MDRRERNRLVEDNLAIVGYLVNDVCSRATHLSRDDLASAGAMGLIMAADTFNSELGVPFGAFARRRILGAMADEMRAADWATRTARKRIRESLAVQESLTAALGRAPSIDEVATSLGVDRAAVTEALTDAARTVSSLDATEADFVAADIASPEDSLVDTERNKYLIAAVQSLPEKMRYIVEQIYFEDRSVKELAEELGATHSAISQQRAEAVRLMRDGLETHYADEQQEVAEVHSRVAPARRSAYLARLAENATAAMSRQLSAPFARESAAS
ncbi:MAG: polymerase sigma factor for flagellar operon FliA [Naasia sp.]|jgi:RNA polymerase sigma factor for flagellar operon FliA|uniref:sigma-70 family RNA polymerase sigma factor n=1 Tax=Naasia sp. TaxID=2546198 RepID=UPI00262BE089|nr:sigma-70 family RNA polymerase sigma factor [Naasia sp.]MCU1570094.1 polymerase sigma factor for flagellar operon FliA [Naasia sp.]